MEAYDELGTPYSERVGDYKFQKIGTVNRWPLLSVKAAHAKHLLPAVARVCHKRGCLNQEERLRMKVLDETNRFVDVIESHGAHLPNDAYDEVL